MFLTSSLIVEIDLGKKNQNSIGGGGGLRITSTTLNKIVLFNLPGVRTELGNKVIKDILGHIYEIKMDNKVIIYIKLG